jgi:hypothetical protein
MKVCEVVSVSFECVCTEFSVVRTMLKKPFDCRVKCIHSGAKYMLTLLAKAILGRKQSETTVGGRFERKSVQRFCKILNPRNLALKRKP